MLNQSCVNSHVMSLALINPHPDKHPNKECIQENSSPESKDPKHPGAEVARATAFTVLSYSAAERYFYMPGRKFLAMNEKELRTQEATREGLEDEGKGSGIGRVNADPENLLFSWCKFVLWGPRAATELIWFQASYLRLHPTKRNCLDTCAE